MLQVEQITKGHYVTLTCDLVADRADQFDRQVKPAVVLGTATSSALQMQLLSALQTALEKSGLSAGRYVRLDIFHITNYASSSVFRHSLSSMSSRASNCMHGLHAAALLQIWVMCAVGGILGLACNFDYNSRFKCDSWREQDTLMGGSSNFCLLAVQGHDDM